MLGTLFPHIRLPADSGNRRFAFLLCSLAVHGSLVGMVSQTAPVEYGLSGNTATGLSPVEVRLIRPGREDGAAEAAAPLIPPSRPAAAAPAASRTVPTQPRDTRAEQAKPAMSAEPAPALPAYLPPGRLTRLPAPARDIDLNVLDIALLPYQGKVELTLFIDAAGQVADIDATPEAPEAAAFAEAVAQRFRNARFLPGEVDGRPVPAQIRITVVSEPIPARGSAAAPTAADEDTEIRNTGAVTR